jgi:glyoxylase-like metal-dependent hydrolase (beta-lactamase superfamily II)
MEIYPGTHLIECEVGGRPLYLPLLLGEKEAVLLDCGTRSHAAGDVPKYLAKIGLPREALTFLVITHPDTDHSGGAGELARTYPRLRVMCGAADRPLIESPEVLFSFRYDHYRQDHGIFYDEKTAAEIRGSCSGPLQVFLGLSGGETLNLGSDRILEVIHLPGHSHGHLGIYDRKHRVLFYGDAIQGRGYQSLGGGWALCPTYLYVEPYLQTISRIEHLGAERIVGCHWPIWQGEHEIQEFCASSRNFVEAADRLIYDCVAQHAAGATLRELCQSLGGKLGEWPARVHTELSFAFLGHLERGVSQGRLSVDRSVRPIIYRRC